MVRKRDEVIIIVSRRHTLVSKHRVYFTAESFIEISVIVDEEDDFAADGTVSVTPGDPILDAIVVVDVALMALKHYDVVFFCELADADRTSAI